MGFSLDKIDKTWHGQDYGRACAWKIWHAPHFMASCGENGNKPLDLGQVSDFGTEDEVHSTI